MSLKMILGFRTHDAQTWMPDVLKTQAHDGKGIEDVAALITKHRESLESSGALHRKRKLRLERRIRELIDERLQTDFWNTERSHALAGRLDVLLRRQSNPYEVAAELLEDFKAHKA